MVKKSSGILPLVKLQFQSLPAGVYALSLAVMGIQLVLMLTMDNGDSLVISSLSSALIIPACAPERQHPALLRPDGRHPVSALPDCFYDPSSMVGAVAALPDKQQLALERFAAVEAGQCGLPIVGNPSYRDAFGCGSCHHRPAALRPKSGNRFRNLR